QPALRRWVSAADGGGLGLPGAGSAAGERRATGAEARRFSRGSRHDAVLLRGDPGGVRGDARARARAGGGGAGRRVRRLVLLLVMGALLTGCGSKQAAVTTAPPSHPAPQAKPRPKPKPQPRVHRHRTDAVL